jgi:hypothetical protein
MDISTTKTTPAAGTRLSMNVIAGTKDFVLSFAMNEEGTYGNLLLAHPGQTISDDRWGDQELYIKELPGALSALAAMRRIIAKSWILGNQIFLTSAKKVTFKHGTGFVGWVGGDYLNDLVVDGKTIVIPDHVLPASGNVQKLRMFDGEFAKASYDAEWDFAGSDQTDPDADSSNPFAFCRALFAWADGAALGVSLGPKSANMAANVIEVATAANPAEVLVRQLKDRQEIAKSFRRIGDNPPPPKGSSTVMPTSTGAVVDLAGLPKGKSYRVCYPTGMKSGVLFQNFKPGSPEAVSAAAKKVADWVAHGYTIELL